MLISSIWLISWSLVCFIYLLSVICVCRFNLFQFILSILISRKNVFILAVCMSIFVAMYAYICVKREPCVVWPVTAENWITYVQDKAHVLRVFGECDMNSLLFIISADLSCPDKRNTEAHIIGERIWYASQSMSDETQTGNLCAGVSHNINTIVTHGISPTVSALPSC